MKKTVFFLILLTLLSSCSVSMKDIPGIYVYKDNYIIDSLIINKDFSYRRVIFKNREKQLLYSNLNKWNFSNGMLELKKFLNKIESSKKIINSKDSTFRSPVINTRVELTKNFFGSVVFDIDRHNCFYKIDSNDTD